MTEKMVLTSLVNKLRIYMTNRRTKCVFILIALKYFKQFG